MSETLTTLAERTEPDLPGEAAPANAFTSEFLALIAERDEALTATAAEFGGPWKVEATPAGFAVFRQWESREKRHAPEGIFRHRETALLVCAAFPAIGHEPFYRQADEQRGFGFPVEAVFGERGWRPMGSLRCWNEDLIAALNVVESVVRSPMALAALLRAAGPTALRRVGEILGGEILDGGR